MSTVKLRWYSDDEQVVSRIGLGDRSRCSEQRLNEPSRCLLIGVLIIGI